MQLRDHDQPCEHGSFINCDLGCPGGRLVQINYEAAQRKAESYGYEAGKFETRPDRTKAVVDAALGVEQ